MTHTDELMRAARAIGNARGVVVLTGAGASAESGIPTYRDGMAALWKSFDPRTLATPEAFAADPAMVTEWYDHRRMACADAVPNAAHHALVALEDRLTHRGGKFRLLTQNVDRLHTKAGTRDVVELHGTIMVWRCTRTNTRYQHAELPRPLPAYPCASPADPSGLLRPDVVWFGEMLPPRALQLAEEALSWCDVFITVGTSATVYPAAGFIAEAAARGAMTIEINRETSPASGAVDIALQGLAGQVLPELVSAAFGSGRSG